MGGKEVVVQEGDGPSERDTPPAGKVGDFRLHGIRMKESAHSDGIIVRTTLVLPRVTFLSNVVTLAQLGR